MAQGNRTDDGDAPAAQHDAIGIKAADPRSTFRRTTHPDAANEPCGSSADDALEFYLRPRDNAPSAEKQP